MKETKYQKPRCGRCGSSYVYVKASGEIICRACGFTTKPKEENKK